MDYYCELELMTSPKLLMNSYKLFLLKSLINNANPNELKYSFYDLAAWMCAHSWKISMLLGKRFRPLDKLFDINSMLLLNVDLLESSDSLEVFSQIKMCESPKVKAALRALVRYAPYRLLSYRWPDRMSGLRDSDVHKLIENLSNYEPDTIYYIQGSMIILSPSWNTFFMSNKDTLNDWIDKKIRHFIYNTTVL